MYVSLCEESMFSGDFLNLHIAVVADASSPVGTRFGKPLSLKNASMSITEDSHQLLAGFDNLGSELSGHMLSASAIEQRWGQYISTLGSVLEAGKGVGEAKVVAMLTGSFPPEAQPRFSEASDALFGDTVD